MASKKKTIPVIKKKPAKKPKPLNVASVKAPVEQEGASQEIPESNDTSVGHPRETSRSSESVEPKEAQRPLSDDAPKAEAVAFNEIPSPKEVATETQTHKSEPPKAERRKNPEPETLKLPDSVESGHAKKKLLPN